MKFVVCLFSQLVYLSVCEHKEVLIWTLDLNCDTELSLLPEAKKIKLASKKAEHETAPGILKTASSSLTYGILRSIK